MKRKAARIILGLSLLTVLGLTQSIPAPAAAQPAAPVYITAPVAGKASPRSINIRWGAAKDASVQNYYVMRRATADNKGIGAWQTIAEEPSDGIKGGPAHSYTDQLDSSSAQQYEYKICTLSKDGTIDTRETEYEEKTNGYAILGTNLKVCIDPGHYGTLNNNFTLTGKDGNFPYSEAEAVLQIGEALKAELKESYGIDSYMTRTGSSISLTYKGRKYTDEILDKGNIAVRGYMAKQYGCDLFISLHTNSTSRPNNPWSQPKSINKTFVFVNQTAHADSRSMKTANAVGVNLTACNQDAGIQTVGFTKRTKNKAANFSNSVNDAANTKGTVIYRKSSSGGDYYGVLRGASADRVPGILVEHAFHATQIVRKLALNNDSTELFENWAACDAYGIAYGFGFETSQSR